MSIRVVVTALAVLVLAGGWLNERQNRAGLEQQHRQTLEALRNDYEARIAELRFQLEGRESTQSRDPVSVISDLRDRLKQRRTDERAQALLDMQTQLELSDSQTAELRQLLESMDEERLALIQQSRASGNYLEESYFRQLNALRARVLQQMLALIPQDRQDAFGQSDFAARLDLQPGPVDARVLRDRLADPPNRAPPDR
ncbi:MAG: hypothetical protein RQ729_01035 [Wenzhouxiangellaceae bacterium]|nr:hypothetical protein [Wenzhouxiangellaceae bacterium]